MIVHFGIRLFRRCAMSLSLPRFTVAHRLPVLKTIRGVLSRAAASPRRASVKRPGGIGILPTALARSTSAALHLDGTVVARPALLRTIMECAAVRVAANTTDSSGTLPTATVKGHHQLKFNATPPIGIGTSRTAVAAAVRRSEIAVARPTGGVIGQLGATLV
jgi:hypothetical protein